MTALNCIVFIVAVVALMWGGARVKLRAPSLAARTVRKNDSGLVLEFDDFGRLPPPVVDVFRAVYSVGKEYVYEGATYRLAEMRTVAQAGEKGAKMVCTFVERGG
mgnify:FL=1